MAMAEEFPQGSEGRIDGDSIRRLSEPTSIYEQDAPLRTSLDGRWGEQETGEPVSRRGAMGEFAGMTKELTRLTLQRTKSGPERKTHSRQVLFDKELFDNSFFDQYR